MMRIRTVAALALVVALAAGCSQQEPAEQAVDAAEQALADVHEMALKYIPGQYGEVKAQLDAARKALQDGEYADALAAARDLPAKATALREAAAAARDKFLADLEMEWPALTERVPDRLASAAAQVDQLARARRLPEGVERAAVDKAPAGLATARQAWTDAQAAHEKGNLERAVALGRSSEVLINMLLESLTPAAADRPAG
jgi:hypothetical protein